MYGAAAASDLSLQEIKLQRVSGSARVHFNASGGKTRLADLYQKGSAKVRLPRVYEGAATAVLINTAGGLTGGDKLDYELAVGDNAHAIVTSQTAERAYRSNSGSAKVTGSLVVGSSATLEWLPQETLLFDRSSLTRALQADLSPTGRLLMLETLVLGRKAMSETVEKVRFQDKWRVRRGGKLIFADDIRLIGNPRDFLGGPATGHNSHVVATFLDCTPDAEDRLALARSCLETSQKLSVHAAASAWNGVLTARFVSNDARDLRNTLISFLTRYRAADLPRVWYC